MQSQQQPVIIHTDGACKGNPGIGAWAAILQYQHHTKEIYGVVESTTNNQMELTAVIEALCCIKYPSNIIVYTDSQYVSRGISEWITGWKARNWKNVKNIDLWQRLDNLSSVHQIKWQWIEGHAGNIGNERADLLCNIAIKDYLNAINT